MTGRPCNPSADLKDLWRALLPNTPFPQCGTPGDAERSDHGGTAPTDQPESAERPRDPIRGR